MSLVFDDSGQAAAGFKGKSGDSVTQAIASVTGVPNPEVYEAIQPVPARGPALASTRGHRIHGRGLEAPRRDQPPASRRCRPAMKPKPSTRTAEEVAELGAGFKRLKLAVRDDSGALSQYSPTDLDEPDGR